MKSTIANSVLSEMRTVGLSQSALSKKSGVDRANINRWLRGRGTLTVESLERLMVVLGLVVVRGNL